jgi:hypothetical protein
MYVQERLRVGATWLVAVLIGLTGLVIIILSLAKADYYRTGSQWLIDFLAQYLPLLMNDWTWSWLPNELLSVQIFRGICLFLISVSFTSYAFYIDGQATQHQIQAVC